MRYPFFTLLASALFATALTAQTVPVGNQETITTGMVGLTASQTARLNVVNLSVVPVLTPVSSTATNTASMGSCSVTLEFYDGQNKLLNTNPTPVTIAPMIATYLDLAGTSFTVPPVANPVAALRHEIRGVVIAKPAPTSSASAVAVACTVKVTLEIYDNLGSTVSLTSDTTVIPSATVTPTTKL